MADGYNNGNWVKVGGGTEFFNFFNLVLDDNSGFPCQLGIQVERFVIWNNIFILAQLGQSYHTFSHWPSCTSFVLFYACRVMANSVHCNDNLYLALLV